MIICTFHLLSYQFTVVSTIIIYDHLSVDDCKTYSPNVECITYPVTWEHQYLL